MSFDADGSAAGTWVLGAPEFVLVESSTTPISASVAATAPAASASTHALAVAAELAAQGLRTLLLAHTRHPISMDGDEPRLPADVAPVVLVTFCEQVRADAARTLSYFRGQGVQLKVISGDDPRTVAAIARAVGLEVDGGYDARTLPEDPQQLAAVLDAESVFGRVSPAQKATMIRSLRESGRVVAMTGDGVNDALAMKEADIGIAMDTSAAVTKSVSRLVLLDGRFDRLPSLVAEGRRVIANIERVSILFLTKTAYAVGMSVVFGALLWDFPFLPRQLSATDGLTIGIPAFFLALMPNATRHVPGFLKRSLSFAIPAGMVVTLALVTVNAVAAHLNYPGSVAQTASAITLSLIALWVLVVQSRPLNLWRVMTIAAMYVGLAGVVAVPVFRDFFAFTWLPTPIVITCAIVSGAGCLGIEVLRRVRRTAVATSEWK